MYRSNEFMAWNLDRNTFRRLAMSASTSPWSLLVHLRISMSTSALLMFDSTITYDSVAVQSSPVQTTERTQTSAPACTWSEFLLLPQKRNR